MTVTRAAAVAVPDVTVVTEVDDWARSLLRPVRDGNAFEVTVERLAQALKVGVVPPGERLPSERDLAELLQVSRMTLREAIKALRDAGFVESRRGRLGGTFVTDRVTTPTRTDAAKVARSMGDSLRDALDYRAVVEPGAAALAATRELTHIDRARLTTCLEACDTATNHGVRRIADSRLHLAVAAVTGCQPLLNAVADVQMQLTELLRAIPVLQRNIAHSDTQHRQIVESVLAGDSERARQVMAAHCEATSALLRGFLG